MTLTKEELKDKIANESNPVLVDAYQDELDKLIALENLDDVLRLPTHIRLAKVLFKLSKQQQTQEHKIKQNQCAQLLGVTVLSAHKALKKLQKAQLIRTAYGGIHIDSIDGLREWLLKQSSIFPV